MNNFIYFLTNASIKLIHGAYLKLIIGHEGLDDFLPARGDIAVQ